MSYRRSQTMILIGSVIVAVLIFFAASATNSQKGTTLIAGSAPQAEASSILKIEDVKTLTEKSANENVQLQGRADGFGIAIDASNRDTKPAVLEADRWEYRIEGNGFAFDLDSDTMTGKGVPAQGSVLKKFDLSSQNEFFTLYPGSYSIKVVGIKVGEKDFGGVVKPYNTETYRAEVSFRVMYDLDLIKSSDNKVLSAQGMQIKTAPESTSPFVIDDDSPKTVTLYMKNENNSRTSAVLDYTAFTVWNSEHRTEGDGLETLYEVGAPCQFLEPNETKELGTYKLSKDSWPIAKDGIAEKLGSTSAVPGTYIVYGQAYTRSCELPNGELIPGSEHTIFAAFEVRP